MDSTFDNNYELSIRPKRKVDSLLLHIIRNLFGIAMKEETKPEHPSHSQNYLDIAGVMFIALDTSGVVSYANRKTAEVLDYPLNEIIGKNWFDHFLPHAQVTEVKRVFEELISGKLEMVEFYENPVVTKKKEVRQISWHNAILKDENNQTTGLLTSGEDITEQRMAEQQLKDSETKFRGIFDHANIAIAITDKKGAIVEVNKEFEKLLGYDRQTLLTMNYAHFTHPDDYKKEKVLVQKVTNNEIDCYRLEKRYLHKSGDIIWVDLSVSCKRNADGETDLVFAMILDITQSKTDSLRIKALERLNTKLLENAPDGVAVKNQRNKLIYASPNAYRQFGYQNDDLMGKSLDEYLHPDDKTHVTQVLEKIKTNPKERETIQYRFINAEKKYRWLEVTFTNLLDDKSVKGIVLNFKDITERKRANEEITRHRNHLEEMVAERTKELEEKNKELERFNRLFVGREFRIKELREEIKKLQTKLEA